MSAIATGGVVAKDDHGLSRLTEFYPNAITDFYGSGTSCIFKTGPEWPVARGGTNLPNLVRAARPIYEHPIQRTWLKTAWAIVDQLDLLEVKWNAVDPLAYANAGDAALICDFVVTVAVQPRSLAYAAAVAAAHAVNKTLEDAGFPDIQVAFIESVYHSLGSGSKLMSTNWLDLEGISGLRKPFTPNLGLAIAPLKAPHYEGSGGLFFRLSSDEADKRIALLTCAHISCPPPLSENKAYTRENDTSPREDVLLLGHGAFDKAVGAIVKFIGDQTSAISSWESALSKFPACEEKEANEITTKRDELVGLINAAKARIIQADKLHSYVTKNFTTPQSRVFGFVLHSAKIEAGEDGFMCDWSLIQLDNEKVEWGGFKGNKLFVGGNKTVVDWENYMYPQADDHDFHAPEDMLLPLKGYVSEPELRNPQDLDLYNTKTLLAVKNGRTTGTTFGRVNGLESITRTYLKDGAAQTALQFVVCNYDAVAGDRSKFSDDGDSGAFVVGRDGRLIGQLTGGGGPKDEVDRSYITPYYALKKAMDREFPGCHLLDS